jgi:hypothetical protein
VTSGSLRNWLVIHWNSKTQIQGIQCFNTALEKAARNTTINLKRTNFNGTSQHFAETNATSTTSDYSFRSTSTDGEQNIRGESNRTKYMKIVRTDPPL